jgi:hypothetical protein
MNYGGSLTVFHRLPVQKNWQVKLRKKSKKINET